MPARLDICLQRNEDWSRTLYLATNGQPIDLTGMTAAMQIREKVTQNLIAEATCEISDPANGEVTVTIKGSVPPLSVYGAPIQAANLCHDLRITETDGFETVIWSGVLTLSRGETQ